MHLLRFPSQLIEQGILGDRHKISIIYDAIFSAVFENPDVFDERRLVSVFNKSSIFSIKRNQNRHNQRTKQFIELPQMSLVLRISETPRNRRPNRRRIVTHNLSPVIRSAYT